MAESFGQIYKTFTVTATPGGTLLADLGADLYDQERVLLLFYPDRTGDVELRYDAADATQRHLIPQDAGGAEPYPDGPWVAGSLPRVLYAAANTDVTIEVIRVTQ